MYSVLNDILDSRACIKGIKEKMFCVLKDSEDFTISVNPKVKQQLQFGGCLFFTFLSVPPFLSFPLLFFSFLMFV